ncbi:MAG TPA: nucleotidyltransferase [candidate division Zixibacteria bacterium]|nr:nucleotidyltransferase [candidate division Zixibacteria bacterium]
MRLPKSKPFSVKPIPVKKIGKQVVLVDGHTRAFAAFLFGLSDVAVYWEDEDLDWEEYEICVEWCKEEGIRTISDLKNRIVSDKDYQVLWLDRCERMQKDLEARRKAGGSAIASGNEVTHSKLLEVKSKFQQAGVDWIVFAGAAASCYGSKRGITDIDILVRCDDLGKARTALKDVDLLGFDIGCGAEIRTAQGVCLFFLDDEMVERASWRQLCGVVVPVMSVEDNIILKAILQRGEEEGKHDIEDTKSMIAHEKIDLQYMEERIEKCKAGKRVKQLLKPLIPSMS